MPCLRFKDFVHAPLFENQLGRFEKFGYGFEEFITLWRSLGKAVVSDTEELVSETGSLVFCPVVSGRALDNLKFRTKSPFVREPYYITGIKLDLCHRGQSINFSLAVSKAGLGLYLNEAICVAIDLLLVREKTYLVAAVADAEMNKVPCVLIDWQGKIRLSFLQMTTKHPDLIVPHVRSRIDCRAAIRILNQWE